MLRHRFVCNIITLAKVNASNNGGAINSMLHADYKVGMSPFESMNLKMFKMANEIQLNFADGQPCFKLTHFIILNVYLVVKNVH